mmetsp:Transcript_32743/g.55207  ORF Transcript_32743/g.55207 Transcript_32743/m.55207 type:complete len:430 (+) Transcript_32743:167-1456(+)
MTDLLTVVKGHHNTGESLKGHPSPGHAGDESVGRKKSLEVKHSHSRSHSLFGLLMILDGIGLAIVAGATILEGVRYWHDYYHLFWDTQTTCLLFWFGGRTFQVVGLMFLIAFAASFQMFPIIEYIGMFLITAGPVLNIIASYTFRDPADPDLLFNREWRSNELLELTGMLILDLSYVDMEEFFVFLTEALGFFTLSLAATAEFDYPNLTSLPTVEIRFDVVHLSEAIGLWCLTVVAFGLYRVHEHKQEKLRQKQVTKLIETQRRQHQHRLNTMGINIDLGSESTDSEVLATSSDDNDNSDHSDATGIGNNNNDSNNSGGNGDDAAMDSMRTIPSNFLHEEATTTTNQSDSNNNSEDLESGRIMNSSKPVSINRYRQQQRRDTAISTGIEVIDAVTHPHLHLIHPHNHHHHHPPSQHKRHKEKDARTTVV